MRLLFAAGALMYYPVSSMLSISRAAGINSVELLLTPVMLRRGWAHYQALAIEQSVQIASIHARLHYSDVSLKDKIESDRASIKFAAPIATCACVVLHPPLSRSGDLADVRRWLDAICDERESLRPSLSLAIENRAENNDGVTQQQLDNLDRLRIVASEWDVAITLDVAHAVSFGIDPLAAIDTVVSRLANVHLSDARNRRYRGGVLNGLLRDHQVPGAGELDMAAISARLRHHRYAGLVTVELSPLSLRAYWPWSPARILAHTRESLHRNGIGGEHDASAGASPKRQVR